MNTGFLDKIHNRQVKYYFVTAINTYTKTISSTGQGDI